MLTPPNPATRTATPPRGIERPAMIRRITALATLIVALLSASVIPASAAGATPITLDAPSSVQMGVTTAVSLHLPSSVAAVEGRLFVNTQAAEFIGVAPRGGGTALTPVSVRGGYAFGAYGL